MQIVRRKIQVQWLSLSFALMALGVFVFGWWSAPNDRWFARKVSDRLDHAQSVLQNEIISLQKQYESIPAAPDPMMRPQNEELRKMKGAIYVLEGGKMIYWSDVPIFNEKQCLQFGEDISLLKWTDGYYLVQRQTRHSRSYVSLILLKHDYAYRNRFLNSDYNPYWNIPSNFEITASIQHGLPIKSKLSDAPVFCLSGSTRDNQLNYEWWAFWLFFSAGLVFFYTRFRSQMRRVRFITGWTLGLITLRVLLQYFNIPRTDGVMLFDPSVCSSNGWNATLGDLFLDILFLMWIGIPWLKYVMRRTIGKRIQDSRFSILFACVSHAMLILSFWIFVLVSIHLVEDSTFEMVPYKVLNLDFYSLLAYCIITLLLFLYLTAEYVIGHIFPLLKNPALILVRSVVAFAIMFMYVEHGKLFLLGCALMFGAAIILSYRMFFYRLGVYIVLVLSAAYVVILVSAIALQKGESLSQSIAKRLSNERDPVVEYRMTRLSDVLKLEANTWSSWQAHGAKMQDSLRARYFSSDAFSPYMISFTICKKQEHIILEDNHAEVSCWNFFRQRVDELGDRVGNSCFWSIENDESMTEYLGIIPFTKQGQPDSLALFVEFYRIDNYGKLGYPELLSDQDQDSWKQYENMGYSYALYKDRKLVRNYGEFIYPRKCLLDSLTTGGTRSSFQREGYTHQVFTDKGDRSTIVSYPTMTLIEVVFSFAYTYIYLFLFFMLLWQLFGFQQFRRGGFESRMRNLLVLWITVLLVGVSWVSIRFNTEAYDQQNLNRSHSKMKALVASYHRNFGDISIGTIEEPRLNNWLVLLSNVLLSDVNIYAPNGDFLSTSRQEAVGKGFIGAKMNPTAYRVMKESIPQRWVQMENIGTLSYVSVYAPLVDSQGEVLGYANIPFFADMAEINRGLSGAIAGFVNIYMLFLLLTLPLSKIISYSVSIPLIRLRDKMSGFQLARKPEQIVYHGEDEIGVLVRAYNKMVSQLNESAGRLASSERDAAWREMARQIAHEIKNPLTPMLLSIQHLMRMKANNTPGWENQLDKVAATLQEQIDILATTASGFSDFAKMMESDYQEVELRSLLENILPLYENYHNISLELSFPNHPVVLMANREQLQRVLVNFMNNAVQAIGDNPLGRIQITVEIFSHTCRLSIKDNGVGIAKENMERLFQPYFTTKTAGTGLGLAISKRIIQNFGGSIFFHSESGQGATFGFTLPYSS